MEKILVLPVLGFFLFPGHVYSEEFSASGTTYFNVTGTIINARVENPRDVLNRTSDVHDEFARNLTRGFDALFVEDVPGMKYKVTVKKLFIWPNFHEENDENRWNLSFAIIVRNNFTTTPKDKEKAANVVNKLIWHYVNDVWRGEDQRTPDGLRIRYEKDELIPEPMVQNIINGYMAFITRLSNSQNGKGGGGAVTPTRTSSGNSSAQESSNSSMKPTSNYERREISYIAYIGITLSMIGLLITMASICYFRRLRKFRRNQILVHICATIMIGMLLSILSFRFKGNKQTCTAIALLLHYFILAALSWMCVEAYNLYRDLVKVFNNNVVSTRAFTIRACIFGYGLPAVIVSITSIVDISVYGQRNDACWMTSLAFLISFLAPVLIIVSINIVFFSLIMREIIQISQRDATNVRPSLRAAVSLSVVLGFCWLLAGISTLTTNPIVTYAFVIMSSFQGLFIFIFHGIGKQELRDSWKSLPIFNWQFNKFMNTESQGHGKTESTIQDTPQVSKKYSTGEMGKLSKDFAAFDSGFTPSCDESCNHAFVQESDLGTNPSTCVILQVHAKPHGEKLK